MISRILVPLQPGVDLDSLRPRLEVTFPNVPEVHLLSVLPEPTPPSTLEAGVLLARELQARAFLDQVASGLFSTRTRTWVRRGEPAREIGNAAVKVKADLIVFSIPPTKGTRRLETGSIVQAVIRGSRHPVLLLRLDPAADGRPRRILLVLEKEEWARKAVALLRCLSLAPEADAVVLELAVPILLPQAPTELSRLVPVPGPRIDSGEAEGLAAALRKSGIPARSLTVEERAVPAVLGAARELGADLVVLPRGGRETPFAGGLPPSAAGELFRRLDRRILVLPV